MGRLIAGVIALAIGVLGAMYWGQAQQADASQHLPLVPSIEAPAATVEMSDSASGAEQCPYTQEQCQQACPKGQEQSGQGCAEGKGSCGSGCGRKTESHSSTT